MVSFGKSNRLVRIGLTPSLIRSTLTMFVLLALSFGYLLVDRGHRVADRRRLVALTHENAVLRSKMDIFAAGVESLKTELRALTESDAQLRLSANMPLIPRDVRAMGIGGGTVGGSEPGAGLQNSIEWLLEQAKFQRSSFYDIATNLEKQAQLQTSTPSIMPTAGWVTSTFGYRRDPFTSKLTLHEGVDIIGVPGQTINATASGTVVAAGPYANWGNIVEIDHGRGLHTFYAHNQTVNVRVGDEVKRGQPIATLGRSGRSTGFHCHYGVKRNGNWVDPMKYVLSDRAFYD